jgi:glucose uptake protein
MILAQNYTQALILLIVGMLCWGLWASMYRMTKKWRYELFYFDVAIGLMLASIIYAFTTGSLGFDGFSFGDDLMHAGKQQWLLAFAAGAVFNLANMIMMGGVVVAGLSVAVPLGLGVSLMIGVGIKMVTSHSGNPVVLFIGSACLLVAVVVLGVAYSFLVSQRVDQMVREGKVKTTGAVPGYNKAMIVSTNAPSATKGLLLSLVAGALMWVMIPLINKARLGDFGLGPYALMMFFAVGLFFSTLVFNLFFVNLPVEGEPLELLSYFQGGVAPHLIGAGAGVVLCTGILAYFVVQASPAETQLHGLTVYTVQQGAVLLAAVVGIFGWKDFRDCEPRVRAMVWMFLLLYVVGLAALGFASRAAQGAAA